MRPSSSQRSLEHLALLLKIAPDVGEARKSLQLLLDALGAGLQAAVFAETVTVRSWWSIRCWSLLR